MNRRKSETDMSKNAQITGNIGLYYVCYQLSRLGWSVMPTSRNARGIDIIAYYVDEEATKTISVQVKTLSKRAPVPLGNCIDQLLGDFWCIVNDVDHEPRVYVMKPHEVRERAHRGEKDGKVSFWLQPKSYEIEEFANAWERIGEAMDRSTGERRTPPARRKSSH
jgi:hypothetical protein